MTTKKKPAKKPRTVRTRVDWNEEVAWRDEVLDMVKAAIEKVGCACKNGHDQSATPPMSYDDAILCIGKRILRLERAAAAAVHVLGAETQGTPTRKGPFAFGGPT